MERGATPRAPRRVSTERDEWFLVLHRGRVAGWHRVVVTRTRRRMQVEERTVFFRPGGGDDVDVRRVETATLDGTPVEFLLMESYGGRMEITGGHVARGRLHLRTVRDGASKSWERDLPADWRLALPEWCRFLDEAAPGETREIEALDLRTLEPVRLLLRREADAASSAPGDPRPWRDVSLRGDIRRARALYRPGDGSLEVELNGATLVARRVTRERVELARQAHAKGGLSVEQAARHPLQRAKERPVVHHPRTGLSLEAPDAGWIPEVREADRGLAVTFEKLGLFSSLEAFIYPLPDPDGVDACLVEALARLRRAAESLETEGEPEAGACGDMPLRTVPFRARHRGEELRGLVAVVRGPDRYAVLVGAAPARYWRWAEPDFRAFVASLRLVP